MSGHRKWSEIRKSGGPESEARVERYKREMTAAMSLADLRRARDKTQADVADVLGMQQPAISRLEKQADLYLSTLRGYVEAMGGKLQLEAVFPDVRIPIAAFGTLAEPVEKPETEGIEDPVWPSLPGAAERSGAATLAARSAGTGLVPYEHDVKRPNLRAALLALAQEVSVLLRQGEIPQRPWWAPHLEEGTTRVTWTEERRPDVEHAAPDVLKVRDTLASYSALVNYVRQDTGLSERLLVDAAGNPIQDESFVRRWLWNCLAGPFVSQVLMKSGSTGFERAFGRAFAALERALEVQQWAILHVTPLRHVSMEGEAVEFCEGVRLRPLRLEELEAWVNGTYGFPLAGDFEQPDPFTLHCAIEVEASSDPKGRTELRAYELRDRLLTALRLSTDQPIYPYFTEIRSLDRIGIVHPVTYSWTIPRQSPMLLTLRRDVLAESVRLWNRLNDHVWGRVDKAADAQRLSVALKRWDDTLRRSSIEDQLLDCWVALEAIFLPNGDQELRYRASMRVAEFLATDGPSRCRIFDEVKASYDWRSTIIHGSTTDRGRMKQLRKKGTLGETVKRTRGYVRQTLLKILEQTEPLDVADLDRRLVGR